MNPDIKKTSPARSGKSVSFLFLSVLVCVIFSTLNGCKKENVPLLLDFKEEIIENDPPFPEAVREQGITGGVCVIPDISVYDPDRLGCPAGALFNISTRNTVYAKEAFQQFKIASLTKLMTAYLTLKYADLESEVTLTQDVVITDPDAWLCGFLPGDVISVYDLLCAALVYSGNDAANGLAAAVSGSVPAFVSLMNEEAKAIGASHTHFANPNGLDQPGHYSTVYDIYLIFNECLKFPEFRKIISRKSVEAVWINAQGEERSQVFSSGNSYLNNSAQPSNNMKIIGGKTGHTKEAGYCLAILSKDVQGDEYISIVLGTTTKQQVYAQTNLLFDMIN